MQDRRGRRDGETRGRDTERGKKIPVLAAEDPSAGSSNRGGPDRGRSRSARQAHKEKLAKIVTKVQEELGRLNGVVENLLGEILEGPQ